MLLNPDWAQACAALVDEDRPTTMRQIAEQVCRKHDVTLRQLRSFIREPRLVTARWEAYWRCRTLLNRSYAEIGRFFGRDHASVMYGVKRYCGVKVAYARYQAKPPVNLGL